MKNNKIIAIAIVFLVSMFILGMTGCTPTATDTTDTGSGQQDDPGRIIVPDNDTPEPDGDAADPDDDTGDHPGGADGDGDGHHGAGDIDNDGSGGPPSTQIIEAGEISIELYVNGVLQNPEFPIEVYNLERSEVEFRFTAAGPELDYYEIQNAGPVNLPQTGELEGNEASVLYEFTFNQDSWEEWGLMVFVRNVRSDAYSKSYKIQAIEIPGLPTSR